MNTTALIGQWSMEGASRDLEGHTRSASDIRSLLLDANRYDQVAQSLLSLEDADPDAVLFKDPREVGWHRLEDA